MVLAGPPGTPVAEVAGMVQARYNVPLVALADGVAYLQEQGQAWEASQEALTAATAAAEESPDDSEAAAALAAAQEAVAVAPGWLALYEELKVATEPQGKAKEVPLRYHSPAHSSFPFPPLPFLFGPPLSLARRLPASSFSAAASRSPHTRQLSRALDRAPSLAHPRLHSTRSPPVTLDARRSTLRLDHITTGDPP